jgi:hypothetical protein
MSKLKRKLRLNKRGKVQLTVFVIIIIIVFINSGKTMMLNKKDEYTVYDFMEKYELETVEVGVKKGQTIWGIQESLLPERVDIREAIFWAKELNPDIDFGTLKPFDRIKVFQGKENISK